MSEDKANDSGQYPSGKLCGDDKGATQVGLKIHDNAVIIGFSQPTKWLGFDPAVAIKLGETLIELANEIKKNAH